MADLPLLENSNFRFILIDAYSEISGTPGGRDQVADLCPPENSNFRFILIDVYSKSSGRNQLADLPLQKTAISDSY